MQLLSKKAEKLLDFSALIMAFEKNIGMELGPP